MKKIVLLALGLALAVALGGCGLDNSLTASSSSEEAMQEPAKKLVVTKNTAAGARNQRPGHRIELEPGSAVLPVFLHPGEDYTVLYRVTAVGRDIKVQFFSTKMSTSDVVIFQCINWVSLYDEATGTYLGATYPYGRELDVYARAVFFLSDRWVVSVGTHRTLRVKYHVAPYCPIGVKITFTLDNEITQVIGVESNRTLSLDDRFDWSNSITGTVVPVGCVDDTGYSPDGTPCFTYQK